MEQTIVTKLLDGQEKIIEKLATVGETVRRHDTETFPDMKRELSTQSDSLFRMESKQNKDILQFNEAKKEIHDRIKPLEDDLLARQNSKKETKRELWKIFWSGVGLFVIGITTGAFDHITNFIKFLISKL